jgi:hypothetical protein
MGQFIFNVGGHLPAYCHFDNRPQSFTDRLLQKDVRSLHEHADKPVLEYSSAALATPKETEVTDHS